MEHLKSRVEHEKVLEVLCEITRDLYCLLSLRNERTRKRDLERDHIYLSARFKAEGVGFATKTLPNVYGAILEALMLSSSSDRHTISTPDFLRPVWACLRHAFAEGDRTGVLTDEDQQLLKLLRTLLYGFKKYELPFDPRDAETVLDNFVEIERSLEASWIDPRDPIVHKAQMVCAAFSGEAEELFPDGCDWFYEPTCPLPKHGPGSVADGKQHNEKWDFRVLYRSVHQEWPYYDYIFGQVRGCVEYDIAKSYVSGATRNIPTFLVGNASNYRSLERKDEPTSKVTLVPKDSRGPRVISMEPSEVMYLQQGVARHLMEYIECNPMTKGHVNFTRQSVNGSLAAYAAETNCLATIDLKDASDRVTKELVELLFPKRVSKAWCALRSTKTILPNGSELPLLKFAAMGSALCFPVESLVFWAITVAVVWEATGSLSEALESVWVYGDDIILTNAHAPAAMDALERVHLRVNRSKSFYGSEHFRESCGVDAYRNVDVTPQRFRKVFPSRATDGTAIEAWLSYATRVWSLAPGFARWIVREIEGLLQAPVPRVPFVQGYLHVLVPPSDAWTPRDWLHAYKLRWDSGACYWTFRGWKTKSKRSESSFPSGWTRLLSDLTVPQESDPTVVVERASTKIRLGNCKITYLGYGMSMP